MNLLQAAGALLARYTELKAANAGLKDQLAQALAAAPANQATIDAAIAEANAAKAALNAELAADSELATAITQALADAPAA